MTGLEVEARFECLSPQVCFWGMHLPTTIYQQCKYGYFECFEFAQADVKRFLTQVRKNVDWFAGNVLANTIICVSAIVSQ